MNRLHEFLRDAPVLIEGAMGTMLMTAGLPAGAPGELFNLQKPERIADIHRQYANAGVRMHFSNTFNGNRIRLRAAKLADRCGEINLRGAQIAREAAGSERLVGGSIGPTGEMLSPLGDLDPKEAEDVFAEQAAHLVEGGVDVLWIETMMSLAEVDAAVTGCRRVSDKPIAVTMTFSETSRGFFTMMGHNVTDCVRHLEAAGVEVVGTNCQLASAAMVKLAGQMRQATRLPLAIQPNAGMPELRDGKPHYIETPEHYAEAAEQLAGLGIELIGGCCGTTPEFLAAAHARLGK